MAGISFARAVILFAILVLFGANAVPSQAAGGKVAITSVPALSVPISTTISKFYFVGWTGMMTGEGCSVSNPCTLAVTTNLPPAGWSWNPGTFPKISVTTDGSATPIEKSFSVTAPAKAGLTASLVLTVTCTKGCKTTGLSDSWTVMLTATPSGCSAPSSTDPDSLPTCVTGVPEFGSSMATVATIALLGVVLFALAHWKRKT